MFCIEMIAILILILFLSEHFSLSQNTRTGITVILGQRECLDRTNTRTWITIILGQKECFVIEIIAILILILVLSKHSLCPRIIEQGLLLFQDKKDVLYRNNSNPYSDIISIQTFSLSQNTRTGITVILGQRECFLQK